MQYRGEQSFYRLQSKAPLNLFCLIYPRCVAGYVSKTNIFGKNIALNYMKIFINITKYNMKNEEEVLMTNKPIENVYQIYDRIFKRILSLSSKAVISLINALFDTDYPADSKITYNWTEYVDRKLKQTLADVILTVNSHYSYHIEAQMYPDEEIELRVFDYSYHHALKTKEHEYTLIFPEPQVIYLYESKNTPDIITLTLDFGTQGSFDYKVPIFKLMEHEVSELDDRRMVILIPFMLLKLRRKIEKERSRENMEALRHLIIDDIMNLIVKNQAVGNITAEDAIQLVNLVQRLYSHLYAHYKEFAEGGFNDMIQDDLVLECDIFLKEIAQVKEEAARVKEEAAQVKEELEIARQKQKSAVHRLYALLGDASQVAEILELPLSEVLCEVGENTAK